MNHLAFVAQGRLYVQTPRGPREVPSQFGETIRNREQALQQRNAWRTRGSGARFMGHHGPAEESDPAEMPIHVTSVAAGQAEDDLLYTLETPAICGLLRTERLGEEEQRLWHCNERRIGDLSRHPSEPRVACSLRHANGTASVATMRGDGSGLQQLTEGDSLDVAPRWIPGSTRLVFQSAGLCRHAEGHAIGLGPFSVQELDPATGQLETLAESPTHDLLTPQVDTAGLLHYIRRPYESGRTPGWWTTLLDVLLLPIRLVQAIFGFFNVFSMLFTGKPLLKTGGARAAQVDPGRMFLWGNLVDARKALRQAGTADTPDLVPKSWELIRREPSGAETVLLRGVVSYDLRPDGSILYTNGSAVFLRSSAGEIEKLAKHSYIQQVVALGGVSQAGAKGS